MVRSVQVHRIVWNKLFLNCQCFNEERKVKKIHFYHLNISTKAKSKGILVTKRKILNLRNNLLMNEIKINSTSNNSTSFSKILKTWKQSMRVISRNLSSTQRKRRGDNFHIQGKPNLQQRNKTWISNIKRKWSHKLRIYMNLWNYLKEKLRSKNLDAKKWKNLSRS